jgi:HK97 family phage portal protein
LKIKIFGRTIEIKNSTSGLPALSADSAWISYLAGKGYAVSANTALKIAVVIRCVDVVAKSIASLPLNLFIKSDDGAQKAEGHVLYKLLSRLPNPETTAYEFWHMYIFNLLLTRGAYAKIVRYQAGFNQGKVKQLWNIPTANVSKYFNTVNGERYIVVNLGSGKTETLREGEFMYTPGLRLNSAIDPENPVLMASEVLGLTMALNGFAKDYFESGSNMGGFIECESALSDESYSRFKESWQETYAGVTNQHKIGFLEDGMKFTKMQMNLEDSQALESRKFAVIENCRIFGVPPHKVYELDRATFSNIEEMNTEFVQDALTPRLVQLEQTMYKDLLTEKEQAVYYAKFNANGLMRGNIAARTAYYNSARQNGWMNSDEIRALEDMNKIPAGQGGDVYAVNGNLIPLSAVPNNLPKGAQTNGKN